MKSVFMFFLACLCVLGRAKGAEGLKEPKEWSLRLTVDARQKGEVYVVDVNYNSKFRTEFVVRKGKGGEDIRSYEVLHVGSLSSEERTKAWIAFNDALQSFKLIDEAPSHLDGGFFAAELNVGARSIRIKFSTIRNTNEVPSGLNHLLKLADERLK